MTADRIDPELRSLLVCPACRGPLTDVSRGLACAACQLVYPVQDGVPFMVAECALPAEDGEIGEPLLHWWISIPIGSRQQ